MLLSKPVSGGLVQTAVFIVPTTKTHGLVKCTTAKATATPIATATTNAQP